MGLFMVLVSSYLPAQLSVWHLLGLQARVVEWMYAYTPGSLTRSISGPNTLMGLTALYQWDLQHLAAANSVYLSSTPRCPLTGVVTALAPVDRGFTAPKPLSERRHCWGSSCSHSITGTSRERGPVSQNLVPFPCASRGCHLSFCN